MQMKLPSFANDPAGRIAFCAILDKLITVGLSGSGASGSLLGDLTHTLDVLETEGDEDVTQLSLWRVIARKWTELWPKTAPTSQEDDEDAEREDQSTPLKNPSMTLGLLANLLTNPFRSCPGSWAVASDSDVKIWQDLLETTCARARVKAYDPNIAVVESLAAGLTDAEVAEKSVVTLLFSSPASLSRPLLLRTHQGPRHQRSSALPPWHSPSASQAPPPLRTTQT
jgi:hypothetical protein